MAFSGIPVAALDFYEDLEDDNSKTFWAKHKHVYEESIKAPMEALAAALEKEFGPGKMFRPYRDVRFAKVKSLNVQDSKPQYAALDPVAIDSPR